MMTTTTRGARSLSDMWKSFKDGVIPPDAPPIQVESMGDAFYSGAFAVMQLLEGASRREGAQGTADMLVRLREEIEVHFLASCGTSSMTGREADELIALLGEIGLTNDDRRYMRMLLTGDGEPPDIKQ